MKHYLALTQKLTVSQSILILKSFQTELIGIIFIKTTADGNK